MDVLRNSSVFGATHLGPLRTSIDETRFPIPNWYVPTFFAVIVTSLALPAGPNRIYYTMPVVFALVSMLYFHTNGTFKKDYDLGNLILGWFLVYMSLILTSPEREFWPKDGQKLTADERFKETNQKSFWQKLKWSFGVWTNPRGVGWSHQSPNLYKGVEPGYPAWKFVARKLIHATVLFLAIDALHLWYKTLEATNPAWTVWDEPFVIRVCIGISNQFRIYCEMASMHSLVAVLTTGLGMYKPSDWPPMVGYLSDAYSLKRWWGMVWHQFFRQVAHPGGLFISRDLLRLPKGSFIARASYLIGAFAFTGFYHTIVNMYATGFKFGWDPCGDMFFFVIQGVGIFVESLMIDLVKTWGHGKYTTGWKWFGYLWVAVWVGYTQIWYVENLRQFGFWDVDLPYLKHAPGVKAWIPVKA